ncbi:MAG: OmpA family protein [Pseudomonadota bacterium]
MRSQSCSVIATGVALLATTVAQAGADPGAWYVGAKGVWVDTDTDRIHDSGPGGQFSLGKVLNEHWDFELNGISSNHAASWGGNEQLQGGGFDINRVFNRNGRVNPFLSFGLGYLGNSNSLDNDNGFYADLGGGLIGDIADFGNGAKLQWRGDGKWRRFNTLRIGSNVYDFVGGLGLQLVWGGNRPEPAPVARAVYTPPPPPPAPAPPSPPPQPPADGDRDGVLDTADRCPNTPAGDKVDSQGCSLRARLKVFFDTNKATLMPESYEDLDVLIAFMKDAPLVTGVMEGHTDSVGSDAANNSLSQRRADSVKAYLVSKGIAGSRVQTRGFGESQPEESNDTADGRAQNRRVIFQRTDVK